MMNEGEVETKHWEGWICPVCHITYPPWVTECKCSKNSGYYTTTQNVHTRFAHKGPLPPPVVDFSTDQCPACGEVLNRCTCPQVLQRVDFGNKELEAENEQLKAQLEKAKCCGSCVWWSYFADEEEIESYCAAKGSYGMGSSYCCDQWEVRG